MASLSTLVNRVFFKSDIEGSILGKGDLIGYQEGSAVYRHVTNTDVRLTLDVGKSKRIIISYHNIAFPEGQQSYDNYIASLKLTEAKK